MPQNTAPPRNTAPNAAPDTTRSAEPGGADPRGTVQGEGDYQAAHRYREEVKEFLQNADVEELARAAVPDTAKQERELALAEEDAKGRSKGDDPVDVGLMYPGRHAEDD